jgi:hypothetical protein
MVVSIRLAVGGAHLSQPFSWAQTRILPLSHAHKPAFYGNENHFHF